MTLLVLTSGQWGGIDLPWWSTLLAVLLISVIQAISGQSMGLNVVSQFLAGWIMEGKMGAVMAFKTVAYMGVYQGLSLTQNLKLGHYLKVPPRVLMSVQIVTTMCATVVNVIVAEMVFVRFAVQYEVFMNAGAIWGLVGPRRFFGPGSPYYPLLLGFLIGAILPLIPYALHRLSPRSTKSVSLFATVINPLRWPWRLVNIPLIVSFPVTVSSLRSDLVVPVIVAFVVNYVVKKWRPDWWRMYAYVMSAAFDTVMSAVPFHLLNRCNELIITSPLGYNATFNDPDCIGFGMAGL
ncbi:OPT oligopeptide transporter protein-domain-containing protein [Chytridium lagenaria]|nr:OPT oligopeptide transporter protein-domain-containing protein [Chytridium lagenaria]